MGYLGPAPGIIQAPAIQKRLQSALGLQQGFAVPELAPELMAVVLVEDLTRESVYEASNLIRKFTSAVVFTAAADIPGAAYYNPSGSQTLLVLETVYIRSSSAASSMAMEFFENDPGTVPEPDAQKQYTDRRVSGTPVVSARVDERATLATPCFVASVGGGVSPYGISLAGWVLPPNHGLRVQAAGAVATAWITLIGYEYPLRA